MIVDRSLTTNTSTACSWRPGASLTQQGAIQMQMQRNALRKCVYRAMHALNQVSDMGPPAAIRECALILSPHHS